MKQNIYFRNGEGLKEKVCELIDECIDFKIEGNCIIIERPNNVKITCKIENGTKTKEIFVDAFFMEDIVDLIYKQFDLEEAMGEPARLIKVEILE